MHLQLIVVEVVLLVFLFNNTIQYIKYKIIIVYIMSMIYIVWWSHGGTWLIAVFL